MFSNFQDVFFGILFFRFAMRYFAGNVAGITGEMTGFRMPSRIFVFAI